MRKEKPIIAATVLVANTTNGTLTDENGNFTLEVGTDQSIQVAYIGMSTVTMSVKDCLKKADQTIVLTESDTNTYSGAYPFTFRQLIRV